MSENTTPSTPAKPAISDVLKNWTMTIVTLIFVILYVLSLTGVIKLPEGARDLQAIVFVIIGYYFGRVPAEKTENTLKEEIGRQATRADAVTNAKEKLAGERAGLEEKIKDVRAALGAADNAPAEAAGRNSSSNAVGIAMKMLDS